MTERPRRKKKNQRKLRPKRKNQRKLKPKKKNPKREPNQKSRKKKEEPKKVETKKEEPKKADAKKGETKKESSDSSDSDDSEDEKPKKKEEPKKSEPKKQDDEDDDDDDDDDENKNDRKRKADDIQAQSPHSKKTRTDNGNVPTGSTDTSEQSKKVFVGNLSYQITEDLIRDVFKDVGDIVEINLFSNADGKFRGSGTLEFESHELAKKAKELHNNDNVLDRNMIVDVFVENKEKGARGGAGRGAGRGGDRFDRGGDRGDRGGRGRGDRGGRGGRGGGRGGDSRGPSEKPEGCTTVYLGNLSYDIDEAQVREVFGTCGTIEDIRWVEKDGQFHGCGFLQFAEEEATDKAMGLYGTEILGRSVRVDYAASKSRKTNY